MPAANWPKLENKRNSAERNVEDAREGNTPVYEELFAARIMLHLNATKTAFPPPTLKTSLFMRIRMHLRYLKQKISIEHLSRVPFPIVLQKLTTSKNSARETL